MKKRMFLRFFSLCITHLFLQSCISNPFGGDEITGGNRAITGEVSLFDGSNPEGVYIWLEGMNLGTDTNADGSFQLALPSDINQNSTSQTNGVLKLFFYLANYGLSEKQVVIRDGEFVYNRGDVNKNGQLTPSLALKRFLHIKSDIFPAKVPTNFSGVIEASVTLEAPEDSVTVVFPKGIGGFLGAVLLKKLDSHQVFIYEAVPGVESVESILVGNASKTRGMGFGISQRPLPVGKYEVIPYLLVAHEAIPAGLLESLGRNVTDLTPTYLNIPFRRETAVLEVTN
ncbi:MAG: hypothetical protein ACE5I1_09150 [bacterium]